jgi:hypothetical protein
MEFPAYVPAAVRAQITTLVEGDTSGDGWQQALDDAESQLAALEDAIQVRARRGDDGYLPGLRKQRAEAEERRDRLAGDVDCLQRLGHDPRMKDVFELLTRQFTDDKQWRNFIYAAWAGRREFSSYRDRVRRAKELGKEIASAAETLAGLLRKLSQTFPPMPSEFYSVRHLFRLTDNHEMQGYNLHMWHSMRQHVLGDLPRQESSETQAGDDAEQRRPAPTVSASQQDEPDTDLTHKANALLREAWGFAPDLSDLLTTLADAARAFEPIEFGMVGAAIRSRQKSKKTEYLRAFGNLLAEVHGFDLTTPIMKAMAIVASVVLSPSDVDVTYDDVRKALARHAPGGKLNP